MRKTIGRWKATLRYNPNKLELLDGVYMPKIVLTKMVLAHNKGIRQDFDNTLNFGKCNIIDRFGILWINIQNPMRTENSRFFLATEADKTMGEACTLALDFEKDFISDGCWSATMQDVGIRVSKQKIN